MNSSHATPTARFGASMPNSFQLIDPKVVENTTEQSSNTVRVNIVTPSQQDCKLDSRLDYPMGWGSPRGSAPLPYTAQCDHADPQRQPSPAEGRDGHRVGQHAQHPWHISRRRGQYRCASRPSAPARPGRAGRTARPCSRRVDADAPPGRFHPVVQPSHRLAEEGARDRAGFRVTLPACSRPEPPSPSKQACPSCEGVRFLAPSSHRHHRPKSIPRGRSGSLSPHDAPGDDRFQPRRALGLAGREE